MSWWKTCCCRWLGTDSETPPTDSGGNERGQHNQNICLNSTKPPLSIPETTLWHWDTEDMASVSMNPWLSCTPKEGCLVAQGTQWKSSHTAPVIWPTEKLTKLSLNIVYKQPQNLAGHTNSHALTTVLFECCVYFVELFHKWETCAKCLSHSKTRPCGSQ